MSRKEIVARDRYNVKPLIERQYIGFQQIFENRFCGLEAVEKVFTLPDGTSLFDITPEVQAHAFQSLEDKLHEHDHRIALWMDRVQMEYPPLKKEELNSWMWMYHPIGDMRIDLDDPIKRGPITINNLLAIDQQLKNREGGSSKYIRANNVGKVKKDWLNTPITPGWTLMTKDFVPNTRNKDLNQRREPVEKFAQLHGFGAFDVSSYRTRLIPIDVVVNAHLANSNGIPFLKGNDRECTAQDTTDHYLIDVGSINAHGVIMSDDNARNCRYYGDYLSF